MAARLPLLVLLMANGAAAQSPRLLDCVEAPIAYVSMEADAAPAADAADAAEDAGSTPGPVQRLLTDPGLAAWLGDADAPTARAWRLWRGVLLRDHGAFEWALTGVVPGKGQPLMLLRVQLQPREAGRLQALLAAGSLATAHRTLGGQQTFRLAASDAAPAAPLRRADAAGELVELALVGNDLLIGNDDLGMSELLAPGSAHTTASDRRVLAGDPQFQALRRQLGSAPGALFVYGDWPRLGYRLQQSLVGVPGALLECSGLGGARRIMLSLAPAKSDYAATLLLSFESDPRTAVAGEPPSPAVDGWLAAAHQVAAKQLVAELPGAGLGGVVVAVDLADLASRSRRGEHLLHELRHSFESYGLDFDRHVLGRLGSLGTVQLLLRDDPTAGAAVAAVYAVRARSRQAAADLFTDLRRAAEAHGIGRLVTARDRRAPDVLELRPEHEHEHEHEHDGRDAAAICVAVVEDSVLITGDAGTIHRVHDDYRRTAKARGRRDAVVAGAVQRIGGDDVCGLFDVDLQGLFANLARSMGAAGQPLELGSVPTRHIGYLALAPQAGGSLLRVCVLSSQ